MLSGVKNQQKSTYLTQLLLRLDYNHYLSRK